MLYPSRDRIYGWRTGAGHELEVQPEVMNMTSAVASRCPFRDRCFRGNLQQSCTIKRHGHAGHSFSTASHPAVANPLLCQAPISASLLQDCFGTIHGNKFCM
jgi:hypothetical protein